MDERFGGLTRAMAVVLATLASGCAALDEAAVAQTERLAEGEFYVNLGGAPDVAVVAALLPSVLDPELATSLGYGQRAAAFQPLLAAINARLQGESCCRYLDGAVPVDGAPTVYLGSADGEFAPPEAQAMVLPQDRFAPLVLHLHKPSAAWSQAVAGLLAREGATHAVVISLGISQYPKGRQGAFGKQVVLGTGHVEPVRFLTAEDKLLEVLQLTGVLVDGQGRVVRAGAEGILARDTPFAAQVLDAEKVLTDDTLQGAALTARRKDLPNTPLKWEVALGNLLAQLRGDRSALRVP